MYQNIIKENIIHSNQYIQYIIKSNTKSDV